MANGCKGVLGRVTVLDLSAYIGLIAVGFATANILIGLMIFGRYSPVRYWPHRRFDIFRIHRWTGYGTLGFTLLHPLPLLLNAKPHFRIIDILLPLWSPQQPLQNTIGAAALYLFVIIIVTSLYRIEIGRHFWKLLHYLTYPAAACVFIHGILTDPNLTGSGADYLDGGKVFVEICCAIIIGVSVWRVRYARKKRQSHRMASFGQEAAAE
ncbi:MAG TPA: ferric reductase-like transmembrane domain-containing protein [Candidatus Acidoferrales bacterium]|nr:ferric reductase-like transmembrane domain-containing protein [Candidatus Acidoferrales bacterium]